MKKAENGVRRALLQIAGNESLFLFVAFLVVGVLPSDVFRWYQDQVALLERYVVVPWGMALCLLRLQRRNALENAETRPDLYALGLLLAWVVVPFGIRFGLTFNNVSNWIGHAVVFFAVYAMTTEEIAARREQLFDQACLLFGLLSLVFGGLLVYCAAAVATIDSDFIFHYGTYAGEGYGFGIFRGQHLCSGVHYNITGMLSVCCLMICLAGVRRSRRLPMRLLYLVAAVLMTIVVVLTQSRTARYALMLALAAGTYGYLAANLRFSRAALRHAAGLAAAAVVLAAAYAGASMLTDAALSHYANVQSGKDVAIVAAARAEEDAGETAKTAAKPKEARAAVDATMSGRTDIWKNLFKLWKSEPKSLLIGNGIGRTGSRIVAGTIHEKNGAVAVHNTYLQHIADFGLIGFGVMCAFLLIVLVPVLRVLFARGTAQIPGYRALCMLVVACLMTGMMESAPLGAMTPMNMMLFYALALLAARGREIAPCKA